nr:hypothetical protein [Tanacetum cinerariifolium]
MVAILKKSDATEGFEQIIDFLSDVTRLQALVDKKRIVITKEVVHEILQLNDAEGVICLPNEEIFAGLARMRYEKPSTKLTFYKAFFSTQWKFFIHTILHSLSAKRTSWNKFSSAMTSALICLSSGHRFNFSKYIFESLVRNVDSSSKFYMYPRFIQLIIQTNIADLSKHTTRYISPVLTQKVFANMRRVGKGFSGVEIPLFETMLVVRDIAEEVEAQFLLRVMIFKSMLVEGLENANAAQQLEIVKLKARVKKLEKLNQVKSSKLRRLKKGRNIVDMDQDEGIELELHSDTPAETPKVKDKGKGILIEDPKPLKKKDQIEMDVEYARKLHEEINKEHEEAYKNIDWNASLDHVQSKEP